MRQFRNDLGKPTYVTNEYGVPTLLQPNEVVAGDHWAVHQMLTEITTVEAPKPAKALDEVKTNDKEVIGEVKQSSAPVIGEVKESKANVIGESKGFKGKK